MGYRVGRPLSINNNIFRFSFLQSLTSSHCPNYLGGENLRCDVGPLDPVLALLKAPYWILSAPVTTIAGTIMLSGTNVLGHTKGEMHFLLVC